MIVYRLAGANLEYVRAIIRRRPVVLDWTDDRAEASNMPDDLANQILNYLCRNQSGAFGVLPVDTEKRP